ncbi:uncharacterized protein JN11_04687 [Mucilaginibacter frigoritolerans]|uniref:Radical SAM core domain-containing protein n=1 Tax=Mucilaginibacter frigoritolerans TaxID=652788 RepID=A0A562TM06_9SPHI|nr:radical SAM protein [Mucilaginibacter frigoritolerans]TWI94577.1 uncharacterized protein JN11_04687 [Mucilaginibacter frigoritolerans]
MKISRYNTFFPYEDKIIGFNALKNDFIILMPELYEMLKSAIHFKNLDELKDIHEDFYNHLVDKGFIVDIDFDELNEVKRMVQEVDHENEHVFQLTINPTMNCNFKCWYCYETHIRQSKMNVDVISSVGKLMQKIVDEKKDLRAFSINWFGGEPLLYFDTTVVPILEKACEIMNGKGIAFGTGFTTNGFLLNQEKLDKCKKLNVQSFQITLDGHRERHNQVRFVSENRGSYDEIISNIKLAASNGFRVTVRLNISKETLNEGIMRIAADFLDLNMETREKLFFSFHEVWQNEKDLSRDIQDVVKYFREWGFNTSFKATWDFVRESCYADKRNHATINYNGDLFKCTARDFETANREGHIDSEGNLIWNEKYERRMNSKFKNKPCLECRIMPICNGGCSQQAIEHENIDYCVNGFDEEKKTSLIREKFFYAIS